MSLGFEIGSEWLDLNPGTSLELEEENPFLQLGDEVVGAYSLPFTARYTPRNVRLTKYAALLQQRVDTTGIVAKCFDTGLQESVGRLKVERPTHNLNHNASGEISLYYLTGSSDFNQEAKDFKLRKANLGGNRTFNWNNNDFSTNDGTGFIGHVKKVMNAPVGAYDYAFPPVINKGSEYTEVMNKVNATMFVPGREGTKNNPIVPFPYLHYVLTQAVAQCGWRIEGAILQDPDFLKVVIVNFRAIDYGSGLFPHPQITFNLQDHVPDWTIPQFLGNLRRRFAWWYDYDTKAKVIYIRRLKDVVGTNVKDMTRFADPTIGKKVNTETTVYSLKNNFTGSYSGAGVDFSKLSVQDHVFLKSNLPAPAEARFRHVHLVIAENNYYICRTDDAGNNWGWHLLQPNVLDVDPPGANQEIRTDVVTLGNEYYNDYLDFIPRIDTTITWGDEESGETSMPLLFYHGKQPNKQGNVFPYASSHPYSSTGQKLTSWSLAFECQLADGTEVGLYHTDWKPLLDTFRSIEDLQVKLNLPRAELMKLKFSDTIAIANVRMYIRKKKRVVPYNGVVQLECVRI